MRQAQELGHLLGIDEILGADGRGHDAESTNVDTLGLRS